MNDDAVDILLAAKDRISDPEKWTCGADARTRTRTNVDAASSLAVAWCARGAVILEAILLADLVEDMDRASRAHRKAMNALDNIAMMNGGAHIMFINDQMGHATTMRMFDEAIRDLKGQ